MKNNYTNPNSHPRFWSLEEISILRTYYNHISLDDLQVKLFEVNNHVRSKSSISVKAQELGISKSRMQNKWSQLEVDYLVNHYQNMTFKQIAKNLERTLSSVVKKYETLDLPKKLIYDNYSSDEIQFLKDNYSSDLKSIAKYLNRDLNSVKYNLKKLGLLIVSKYKFYTDDEIKFLTKNSHLTCDELSKIMNRSKSSIRDKMKQLGIYEPRKKSKSYEFSENEILKVKLYYPNYSLLKISKMINRNINELNSLVKRMGLKKTKRGLK
ncbi:hypothetical protein ACIB15232_0950 [Aliarcobacter cibarius]|uniref:hypothetical protein n=1 Tax=Aliarcobacter cibarius TaxID=255507 RepID=UPI0012467611|nr:hypothetical protein [Aliarcobacter cibarius]QEZ89068.1 hypothetical protein ACIB15232_0950 [Aliarcobacter cibarius]